LFEGCVRRKVRLITSQLVIAEVHRLLLFSVGIAAAATAVQKIYASPSVTVEYATIDHHRAAMKWLAKLDDQVISYTDAISFSVMVATRCEIALSFDDDFVIAGFTHLHREMLET
jgi:predicted nucleic acid-binding protein